MTWWIWMLVLALPVGYLRLVAHELSHAVATIVTGGTVDWKRFRPWPHKANGRWYWGRMYRFNGDSLIIYAAPLGRATVGMLLWIPFAALWTPLWICVFWELTDVIHWWRGWFWQPMSDGHRVRTILLARRDLDMGFWAGLVPQDNEMEAAIREASTYDAKKLAEVRKLWEDIPRKEVE
jgi:hypothetical protein